MPLFSTKHFDLLVALTAGRLHTVHPHGYWLMIGWNNLAKAVDRKHTLLRGVYERHERKVISIHRVLWLSCCPSGPSDGSYLVDVLHA
jgi:hypothetical protein